MLRSRGAAGKGLALQNAGGGALWVCFTWKKQRGDGFLAGRVPGDSVPVGWEVGGSSPHPPLLSLVASHQMSVSPVRRAGVIHGKASVLSPVTIRGSECTCCRPDYIVVNERLRVEITNLSWASAPPASAPLSAGANPPFQAWGIFPLCPFTSQKNHLFTDEEILLRQSQSTDIMPTTVFKKNILILWKCFVSSFFSCQNYSLNMSVLRGARSPPPQLRAAWEEGKNKLATKLMPKLQQQLQQH